MYLFEKNYDLEAILLATRELSFDGDYKNRAIAEYWQLRVRFEKLRFILYRFDNGTLGFTPICPIELLRLQCTQTMSLLSTLEERAKIENIELEEFAKKFRI